MQNNQSGNYSDTMSLLNKIYNINKKNSIRYNSITCAKSLSLIKKLL